MGGRGGGRGRLASLRGLSRRWGLTGLRGLSRRRGLLTSLRGLLIGRRGLTSLRSLRGLLIRRRGLLCGGLLATNGCEGNADEAKQKRGLEIHI